MESIRRTKTGVDGHRRQPPGVFGLLDLHTPVKNSLQFGDEHRLLFPSPDALFFVRCGHGCWHDRNGADVMESPFAGAFMYLLWFCLHRSFAMGVVSQVVRLHRNDRGGRGRNRKFFQRPNVKSNSGRRELVGLRPIATTLSEKVETRF